MRIGATIALAALAGCSTPPGTGWSRAPDLSVYAAMESYGEIAREQEMLCGGFDRASVEFRWAEDFAVREAAVAFRLAERHGAEAVDTADAWMPRVPCEELPTPKWRHRYERLLRLLETRLGLSLGERRRGLHLDPVDLRAGLLRRLLCRLVGDAGAAHAADGGDQRHLLGDHRRRADRGRGGRRAGREMARPRRGGDGQRQHLRRLRGDRADARHVQEEGAAR